MKFNDVILNVADSIKNEQESLTNLIKEEALKIQKFIDLDATDQELIDVNNSVNSLIEATNQLEEILKEKLNLITPYLNN